MSLKILGLCAAADKGMLNQEWMKVINESARPFNMEGCSITVGRGTSRPRVVTTLKAGITIKPAELCRLVTGSSGKKSHGEALQEEGVRNIHLFLKAPYLERPGLVVRLTSRQREICRVTFDPQQDSGLRKEEGEGAEPESSAGSEPESSAGSDKPEAAT